MDTLKLLKICSPGCEFIGLCPESEFWDSERALRYLTSEKVSDSLTEVKNMSGTLISTFGALIYYLTTVYFSKL